MIAEVFIARLPVLGLRGKKQNRVKPTGRRLEKFFNHSAVKISFHEKNKAD